SGRLDHTRAAFALNKTMKSVHVPLDQQILYILACLMLDKKHPVDYLATLSEEDRADAL
ncbi:hypothetical protein EV363DRAFT_1162898, partial [Boletus edulis]